MHADIRQAGRKAQRKHHAARRGMQGNHLRFGQTSGSCDIRQVGAVFAAITNRDFDFTCRGADFRQPPSEQIGNRVRQTGKVQFRRLSCRLVVDRDCRVGRHDICHARETRLSQCSRSRQAQQASLHVDFIAKIQAQAPVTLSTDAKGRA